MYPAKNTKSNENKNGNPIQNKKARVARRRYVFLSFEVSEKEGF